MNADIFFITAMAVGALAMAYVLGRVHQQSNDRKMTPAVFLPEDIDPYLTVPVDVPGAAELAQELVDTAAIEMVSFTGVVPDVFLALDAPVVDAPLLAVQAARDRYKVRFEKAERLRARYLRLLKVERARLAFFMGDYVDAPRRMPKTKLAAVVLDMPRGAHLRLVPRPIATEWAAA